MINVNAVKNFFQKDITLLPIVIESIVLLSFTTLVAFAFTFILARARVFLYRKYKNPKFNWHIEVLKAMQPLISRSLWILCISYIVEITFIHYKFSISSLIPTAKTILIILAISNSIIKSVSRLEDDLLDLSKNNHKAVDKVAVDIMSKLIKAVVWLVAVLYIMHVIGINISGLIAVGGIGGLAVGFASKDLLSNFFGTVMIYLDKPFVIGESVKIDGKDRAGTIEKVDWRMTTIRTDDKKQLFIPNSVFLNASIENSSRISHRIFSEQIKISAQDYREIMHLTKEIKRLVTHHKYVDEKQTINVDIVEISKEITTIKIRCHFDRISLEMFSDLRNELIIDIVGIVQNQGLCLAPSVYMHHDGIITQSS